LIKIKIKRGLKMKFTKIFIGLSLSMFAGLSVADVTLDDYDTSMDINIKGGVYSDRAVYNTAGRETQVWKMTNVTIGLDVKQKDGNWGGRVEIVPLGDEVKKDPNDAAYFDYYKNLGTDILYYGDYPLGEAFVYYDGSGSDWRIGRMVNIHGFDLKTLPYSNRHEAPHSVFMDKELLTGVHYNYSAKGFGVDVAVLNGRGRPNSDYNYYLNGQTDPNTKGNNTPIVESKISYENNYGGFDGMVFASYHHNKTGSAPGSLYNGKHNDNRMAIGAHLKYDFNSFIDSFEVFGQYSKYDVGLTEDGVQKIKTPLESKDFEKNAWFVTPVLNVTDKFSIQYTYEEMDRIDARIWDVVANFDETHSSLNAKEKNSIISLKYKINKNVKANLFYTSPDNPFESSSNINASEGSDKYGLVIEASF
jgi:hypothetical protein